MIKKLLCIIILICFLFSVKAEAKELNLHAKSAVLMDEENGRILYEKNAYEKLPMASTTKIMTCILALEYGDKKAKVVTSKYAASMPDVQLNMQINDEYYLGDLLYSLMLESHNDTAVAIAENISGSVEEFAKLMNEKANEIGLEDTCFVTPNGLDDDNHYTTASDLAKLARYALKNEEFIKIINTRTYSFNEIKSGRSYQVNNKNRLLDMIDGAIGVKTGFTGNAGYCFVGAVRKGNKHFISVVLASGWPPNKNYKWEDTKTLISYGQNNYEHRIIYSGKEYKNSTKVKNGIKDKVEVYSEGYENILVKKDEKVAVKYLLNKSLKAPIRKNQIVGRVEIYVNDVIYKDYFIKAKNNIKEKNYKWKFNQIFTSFLLDFL